jgi:hypothetical protein
MEQKTGVSLGAALMGLVVVAVAVQVLVLASYGHTAYLWVQGGEAAVAALPLLGYGLAYRRHDPRLSRWPPLLPLAAIAGSGAVKDFYVAAGAETPVGVIGLLLASVAWFLVSSWQVWQVEGRERDRTLPTVPEGNDPRRSNEKKPGDHEHAGGFD